MSEVSNALNMAIFFLAGFLLLNIFKLSRSHGRKESCDFNENCNLLSRDFFYTIHVPVFLFQAVVFIASLGL